jgi:histidine phosphotransferase ChpT
MLTDISVVPVSSTTPVRIDRRSRGPRRRVADSYRERTTQSQDDQAIDLKVGQLLCSRLCHDLIGPAAAISAGDEFMSESTGQDSDEARALIADSARQLAGRLAFFRVAFGQCGSATAASTNVRSLVDGFLAGGRVRLDWVEGETDTSCVWTPTSEATRLVLCLLMLATDALPRGGEVRMVVEATPVETRVSLVATGRSARLSDDVREALALSDIDSVTARTVHAFYLGHLANRLNAEIGISDDEPATVRLDTTVSHIDHSLQHMNRSRATTRVAHA